MISNSGVHRNTINNILCFKDLERAKLSNSLKKATRIAKYVFANSLIASASLESVTKVGIFFFAEQSISRFKNLFSMTMLRSTNYSGWI